MSDGETSRDSSSEEKAKAVADEQESRAKVQDRESREQTPTSSEKSLTRKERDIVAEHSGLSSLTVYSIIHREGEEELHRPKISLWWSGMATLTPAETLLRGIPSGFFIAAIVWMLPSAKRSEVLVIVMFTWLIAAGDFTHVIAGSNEIFTLVLSGEMNIFTALLYHIAPVLIGNILGGTGLFAMLAYGQVHEEM